jgi:glycosyltransferase involved in cell wall biosynthesis
MNSLTIGVAVITFNGLKYLPQQLDSILQQTRQVHHIVISDDKSTDGTWEFLEAWAAQAPVRVTLIRNDTQLGLSGNFEQSIAAVEADIIFTADQDDIWVPDRVRLLMQVFEDNPNVLLVHTDAALVDSSGQEMGKTLLNELAVSRAEREAIHAGNAFAVYCRRNVVTGATVAIRRTLLDMALPFPTNHFHDAWLALIAAAAGEVRLLDIPTIAYRQHGNNLIGVKKLGPWMAFRHLLWQMKGPEQLEVMIKDNVKSQTILHERLRRYPAMSLPSLSFAAASLAFYNDRAALPHSPIRRMMVVMKDFLGGRYGKFSYAPRTHAIRDLFRK